MPPISLNLIAIGIFAMTMFALLSPLFNIPLVFPAATTFSVMALLTIDAFAWNNRGVNLLLDLFASTQQRERVLYHEAGHFLTAYFLGVPIQGYSLTAWEAFRLNQPGRGGVQFDTTALQRAGSNPNQVNLMLDRFCTVWCGGMAAEILHYGNAEGGRDDRAQLQTVLTDLGYPERQRKQKEQWATLQAKSLIERNQQAYEALVKVMRQRASVETCEQIIQHYSQVQITGA